MIRHGDNTNQILSDAFRVLTSRRASPAELEVLQELYQSQLDYFSADEQRVKSFLAVGDAPANQKCEPTRLAATTVVISTLLNYDESVMKR